MEAFFDRFSMVVLHNPQESRLSPLRRIRESDKMRINNPISFAIHYNEMSVFAFVRVLFSLISKVVGC